MFFGKEVNHLPNYMKCNMKKCNMKKYKPSIEASHVLKFQKEILSSVSYQLIFPNSMRKWVEWDREEQEDGKKKKEKLVMTMTM
jgi:hypothetical protein